MTTCRTVTRRWYAIPYPLARYSLIDPAHQTFSCFVFLDLVSAIQNRGLGCGLTQNRMLMITVAISFLSQLALVYVPFMQAIFQTEALPLDDLLLLLALAASSFVLHESRRRYERSLDQRETYVSAMEELA
jgi:Ca2+-transporting ATPase